MSWHEEPDEYVLGAEPAGTAYSTSCPANSWAEAHPRPLLRGASLPEPLVSEHEYLYDNPRPALPQRNSVSVRAHHTQLRDLREPAREPVRAVTLWRKVSARVSRTARAMRRNNSVSESISACGGDEGVSDTLLRVTNMGRVGACHSDCLQCRACGERMYRIFSGENLVVEHYLSFPQCPQFNNAHTLMDCVVAAIRESPLKHPEMDSDARYATFAHGVFARDAARALTQQGLFHLHGRLVCFVCGCYTRTLSLALSSTVVHSALCSHVIRTRFPRYVRSESRREYVDEHGERVSPWDSPGN